MSRRCVLLLILALTAAMAGSGPTESPASYTGEALEARLAALAPDTPEAYFELGEEIASERTDAAGRRLARTLYVLAFDLDRRRPAASGGGTLSASVCLALAQIASDEHERGRLSALAARLSGGAGPAPGGDRRVDSDAEQTAFALATALGHIRVGENARAAPILERPDVRRLLDRYSDFVGGADALVRDVSSRPYCRECRNTRVVRDDRVPAAGPEGIPTLRLCPTCGGRPGHVSERRFIDSLRLESILLSGGRRSWSAQLLADGGAPLRELD